jgi:hypothetical protein
VSARPIAIFLILAGAALAGAACDRGEAAPLVLPPDAAATALGPEPVGASWVTCYGPFRPAGTPERDVVRLGRLCGPVNGMKLLGTVIEAEATEGFAETRVNATLGQCLRIFAVADAAVRALMVEVRDAHGAIVAADHNNDRWPILNPDGPFCITEAGELTVRVRARGARGKFAMAIWSLL